MSLDKEVTTYSWFQRQTERHEDLSVLSWNLSLARQLFSRTKRYSSPERITSLSLARPHLNQLLLLVWLISPERITSLGLTRPHLNQLLLLVWLVNSFQERKGIPLLNELLLLVWLVLT
jgi:hypothetical protein